MEIKIASFEDAETISKLANEIWPATYADILSGEQICFMLAQSYTTSAIEEQMKTGHLFFLLETDGLLRGFASIAKHTESAFKLQKLYIHQSMHHKGAGKLLISHVEGYCKTQGAVELLLNVNRNNKAKFFYEKMGYRIIEVVDIPYHQFVLNDYVMAKALSN